MLMQQLPAGVILSCFAITHEGVVQWATERLVGLELKHNVISVRPLIGAL